MFRARMTPVATPGTFQPLFFAQNHFTLAYELVVQP